MTDVTLRATKGSPLTHTEMDDNQIATRSGRKNLIIGGNFDTNPWQRGTAFTGVTNNDYTADRVRCTLVGTGVVDVDKVADAPSVAQVGFVVSNCMSWDVTTADASIGASDRYEFQYRIEGYDYAQIAQNDFVVSFWHKHTKTGTYCIGLRNSGFDRSYVAEYTQSVSDTWEKATIKVTASPSAGTWNYTTGRGLSFSFSFAAGSNVHTTADTWQTGSFVATSSQVNAMDSTSNFCRFALIQVEGGTEATDFERRTFGEELALCQRYYTEQLTSTNQMPIGIGYRVGSNVVGIGLVVPQPMRTSPTITQVSTVLIHSDGASYTVSGAVSVIQTANTVISWRQTATGLLSLRSYVVVPNASSGFTFDAEL